MGVRSLLHLSQDDRAQSLVQHNSTNSVVSVVRHVDGINTKFVLHSDCIFESVTANAHQFRETPKISAARWTLSQACILWHCSLHESFMEWTICIADITSSCGVYRQFAVARLHNYAVLGREIAREAIHSRHVRSISHCSQWRHHRFAIRIAHDAVYFRNRNAVHRFFRRLGGLVLRFVGPNRSDRYLDREIRIRDRFSGVSGFPRLPSQIRVYTKLV